MFLDLRDLAMLALHKSWSSFLVISTEIIHLKIGFSIIKTPSILGETPLFLETLIWVSDKIRYDQSSIERVVGLPLLQNR